MPMVSRGYHWHMKIFVQLVKWLFFIVYLVPASLLGIAILYGTMSSNSPHDKKAEKPHIIEHLPNGFIYDHGKTLRERAIKDEEGKIIIYPSVDKVRWKEKTIYGKRLGLSEFEEYYFVCDYGDDCLKKQNYTYGEFFKILQQRHLPGFEDITEFEWMISKSDKRQ